MDNPIFDNINEPTPVYDEVKKDAEPEETQPGFIARSRKAFVAGLSALAGSLGLSIGPATSDGDFNWSTEGVPIVTIAVGIGVAVFFATWSVPNEK